MGHPRRQASGPLSPRMAARHAPALNDNPCFARAAACRSVPAGAVWFVAGVGPLALDLLTASALHFAPASVSAGPGGYVGCFLSDRILSPSLRPCPRFCVCLQIKSMRHTLSRGWAARRWHIMVGIRVERVRQWAQRQRCARLYPVRVWLACGCPSAFVPRVPWWVWALESALAPAWLGGGLYQPVGLRATGKSSKIFVKY